MKPTSDSSSSSSWWKRSSWENCTGSIPTDSPPSSREKRSPGKYYQTEKCSQTVRTQTDAVRIHRTSERCLAKRWHVYSTCSVPLSPMVTPLLDTVFDKEALKSQIPVIEELLSPCKGTCSSKFLIML